MVRGNRRYAWIIEQKFATFTKTHQRIDIWLPAAGELAYRDRKNARERAYALIGRYPMLRGELRVSKYSHGQ